MQSSGDFRSMSGKYTVILQQAQPPRLWIVFSMCTKSSVTTPLHQHLWHLLLTLSAQGDQDLNGSQSNGLSHNAIGRSESLLQPFPLQMRMITALMTPLTSFMHIQPLLLSPHLINNPSSTLTLIYGTQHVKKRWRLTDSMAPGRSLSCPLGSMQLAPDGFSKSSIMLMAPWTASRPGLLPKASLSTLALIIRRPLPPLYAIPPFAPSWPFQH